MRKPINELSDEEFLSLYKKNKKPISELSDDELLSLKSGSQPQKISQPNDSGVLGKITGALDYPASFAAGFLTPVAQGLQNVSKGTDFLRQFAQGTPYSKIDTSGVEFLPKDRSFSQLVMPNMTHGQEELSNVGKGTGDLAFALAPYSKGNLLKSSALGGLSAGITNEDPLLTGSIAAAAPGALKIAGKAAKILSPTNLAASLLKGNLSAEDLASNLRAAHGTETGIGDVIGNSFLKRYLENTLAKAPLTGAAQALDRAAKQTEQKGSGILKDLLGKNDPIDHEKVLHTSLIDMFKKSNTTKRNLYNQTDEMAHQLGFTPSVDNFTKAAKKYKDLLDDTVLLKNEPKTKALLKKLAGYSDTFQEGKETSQILDESGRPLLKKKNIKMPSLKEANLMKGKLNELAADAGSSIDLEHRQMASVFSDLARSLRKDIKGSLDKFGHEGLSKSYADAENFYANNHAKYLDKEIYPFIKRKNPKDSDELISSFVKTGKSTDKANKIEKLANALPEDKRDLLSYSYLSRALNRNGTINQNKLSTLLGENALGNRQFNALFKNPEIRQALTDYKTLVKLNQKGISIMENPATGQQNPLGASRIMANLPFGQITTKMLTSPSVRQKLVNKIISKK